MDRINTIIFGIGLTLLGIIGFIIATFNMQDNALWLVSCISSIIITIEGVFKLDDII